MGQKLCQMEGVMAIGAWVFGGMTVREECLVGKKEETLRGRSLRVDGSLFPPWPGYASSGCCPAECDFVSSDGLADEEKRAGGK